MGSVHWFVNSDLEELRSRRLAATRALAVPDILAAGWHHDLVDAAAAVAAFPGLTVRSGFELRTSHHWGPSGCAGFVWALPRGAAFPQSGSWTRDPAATPPAVAGALNDPMEAIEGPGEAWHRLCAAILQRELAEPGCTGAFLKWGKHDLIDRSPWDELTPIERRAALDQYTKGLYWFDQFPSDLRPRLEDRGDSMVVRFFTRRVRKHMPVYLHEDRFPADSLSGQLGRRLIGRVPIGRGQWPGFD